MNLYAGFFGQKMRSCYSLLVLCFDLLGFWDVFLTCLFFGYFFSFSVFKVSAQGCLRFWFYCKHVRQERGLLPWLQENVQKMKT